MPAGPRSPSPHRLLAPASVHHSAVQHNTIRSPPTHVCKVQGWSPDDDCPGNRLRWAGLGGRAAHKWLLLFLAPRVSSPPRHRGGSAVGAAPVVPASPVPSISVELRVEFLCLHRRARRPMAPNGPLKPAHLTLKVLPVGLNQSTSINHEPKYSTMIGVHVAHKRPLERPSFATSLGCSAAATVAIKHCCWPGRVRLTT